MPFGIDPDANVVEVPVPQRCARLVGAGGAVRVTVVGRLADEGVDGQKGKCELHLLDAIAEPNFHRQD